MQHCVLFFRGVVFIFIYFVVNGGENYGGIADFCVFFAVFFADCKSEQVGVWNKTGGDVCVLCKKNESPSGFSGGDLHNVVFLSCDAL